MNCPVCGKTFISREGCGNYCSKYCYDQYNQTTNYEDYYSSYTVAPAETTALVINDGEEELRRVEEAKIQAEAEAKRKAEEAARQKQINEEKQKANGLAQLEIGGINYSYNRYGESGDTKLSITAESIKNKSIFSSGKLYFKAYLNSNPGITYDNKKTAKDQNFVHYGTMTVSSIVGNSTARASQIISNNDPNFAVMAGELSGVIHIYQEDSNQKLSFVKSVIFRPKIPCLSSYINQLKKA